MTVELPFEFCAPVEHARDFAPEDGRQRRLSTRAVDDPDLRPVGTGFPDDRPGNGGAPKRRRMESSVASSGSDMVILRRARLRFCLIEEALWYMNSFSLLE